MNGNSSLVRRGTAASVALLIVVLAAWQWGPGLLGIPTFIIPPLSAVFDEFLRMLAVSALMTHTGVTCSRRRECALSIACATASARGCSAPRAP